ncbi:lipopolysaccharide biosynthesis protein [Massilia sp. Root418]|uniref:lipopolysaccharide biosynthesis protein n=1 Tax=Massilia sp. Root418 TaxID=1736532 RepID=UPI0009E9D68A|nr:oligosaccharide flippase family protein [Massilia sp. Root418]
MSENYSGRAFNKSIGYYVGGRFLNALAAFFILIWIARQLPENQYINYVAAYSIIEMGIVLSGFGMEWVTGIYIPQIRMHASGRALYRFVWQSAGLQALLLAGGSLILFFTAPLLTHWLGLRDADGVLRLYAGVMLIEGVSRVFRDQLLSSLLLQKAGQASQLLRNVALAGYAVLAFSHEEWRNAHALAVGELIASSCSLLVAAWCLQRHLLQVRLQAAAAPAGQAPGAAAQAPWRMPAWRDMLRVGRNAWLSNIANLTWSWQAVILLATRTLGPDAAAPLGFARNLAEQVRKYLPSEFLLGIVRTLLVVRYAAEQDKDKLGLRAGLIYKVNLLCLLPLLVLCAVRGADLAAFLSNGRYPDAHWLLTGWLAVLVILAHRRLTDLMAHTLGRSSATTRANFALLVTPLALLLAAPQQRWSLLFAVLVVAETVYSALVLRQLRTPHWHYRLHWSGLAKYLLAGLLAAMVLAGLPGGADAFHLALALCAATGVSWGALLLLRPLSAAELGLLPARALRLLRQRPAVSS